jgi:hypothetical protein
VELRKLNTDGQSETEELKQIVRMKDWLASERFDLVRRIFERCFVDGSVIRQRNALIWYEGYSKDASSTVPSSANWNSDG